MSNQTYNKEFFDHLTDSSARSAEIIVPTIVDLIKPTSVVDLGCGRGTWLKAFINNGITDVRGIDGDWVMPDTLLIEKELFTPHDLKQSLIIDRQFDLAISLEVAEHLPEEKAETIVSNLVSLSPVVVFSAAIPFQGGIEHVNERWPSYWFTFFDKHNYRLIDAIRPAFWSNNEINYYYAQNILIYVRDDILENYPALAKHYDEDRWKSIDLVHPKKYLSVVSDYDPFATS